MKLGSTGHYFIWYLVPTHSAHRDYSFLSLIQTPITKNPIEIKKVDKSKVKNTVSCHSRSGRA
jgi:hypothetical protein